MQEGGICPNCGRAVKPSAKFCSNCRFHLVQPRPLTVDTSKWRTVTWFLMAAIIFFVMMFVRGLIVSNTRECTDCTDIGLKAGYLVGVAMATTPCLIATVLVAASALVWGLVTFR